MKDTPMYKSIKVTFAAWQAITRISAHTGETRSQIVERLADAELERIKAHDTPADDPRPRAAQEG